MKNRVVIVCNGSLYDALIREITPDDYVIGVDRAAYWLLTHGVAPQLAIGDFDSANPRELSRIRKSVSDTRVYHPEKDFTDTELAVQVAIERHPSEIVILGGWGTRMDHTLATLSLLEQGLLHKIPMSCRNETNHIQLISRGRTIVKKRGGFTYISLIPYSATITVTLKGLKYPLARATIRRGQTVCISNEFLSDTAMVTIHTGRALLIASCD